MFETMTRWMSGEPSGEARQAAVPVPPTALPYVDQQAARLDAVRVALTETRAALASADARWVKLTQRADDPETDAARQTLGPQILDLRRQVQRLTSEEAATEQAVSRTVQLATEYAALVADTTTRFQPLFDAVVRLTPETLADAYRTSRELDRMASNLLARSGDRTFRRPACDPFRALREALTEAQRVLDRQRVLFLAGADVTTKTKTAS